MLRIAREVGGERSSTYKATVICTHSLIFLLSDVLEKVARIRYDADGVFK